MIKRVCIAMLICFFASCGKDEIKEETKTTLQSEIISITPQSAVINDTVKIKLKNATVSNFSSVNLNDEAVTVLEQLSSGEDLYFLIPPIRGADTSFDLTVNVDLDSDALILKDAFELKRMQIDSVSSNILFQQNDTITVYGKDFPKGGPESFGVYERSTSDNGEVVYSNFQGNKVEGVYKDSLIVVLNRFAFITEAKPEVHLTAVRGGQFITLEDVLEGDFVPVGDFEFSSFFALQPLTVYTPDQRFFIRNNNFEDKIFVNGLEAPRLFSAPEPFEDFNRRSGYQVPAGLEAGEYVVTGTTKDDIPLKNIGMSTIVVSDITFCPESNTVDLDGTFRVVISPEGALNKFACNNCPTLAALVDDISGMRWEFDIDAFNDVNYEDGKTFIDITVPDGIVPNGFYSIDLETANGYKYIPSSDCSNPKIFVQQ